MEIVAFIENEKGLYVGKRENPSSARIDIMTRTFPAFCRPSNGEFKKVNHGSPLQR